MSAKCDCKDCSFRGMELCEHRKMIDDNAKLREALRELYLFEETKGDGFRHGEDYCMMMARAKDALAHGCASTQEEVDHERG